VRATVTESSPAGTAELSAVPTGLDFATIALTHPLKPSSAQLGAARLKPCPSSRDYGYPSFVAGAAQQLGSIGGNVNPGSPCKWTPPDDLAIGLPIWFGRAVAMAVRVGRHGRVTHELLLHSGRRAIFGHPTPVGIGKCVPANSHQAEFSGHGSEVVLLDGSWMVAAASYV
jgi:hypothetical protein